MNWHRREFLKKLVGTLSLAGVSLPLLSAETTPAPTLNTKKIPSTGFPLPVIGMGTWVTFNVGQDQKLRDARTEVLKEFFKAGGGMIDSSPMYGSSEEVLGYALSKLKYPPSLFSATKVWTSSASKGRDQIKDSQRLWGLKTFDLFQVHNLEAWEEHLKTLFSLKEKGELKYVGITTSHGRRHEDLEKIMRTQPLDFVQLTYNMADLRAENKLLDLAQEKGMAVIANRPLDGGDLVARLKNRPLPPWASDIDCRNWPEFLLKFVVSHPAITCAIPATSQVIHMQENMGAARGKLPDKAMRERMLRYVSSF